MNHFELMVCICFSFYNNLIISLANANCAHRTHRGDNSGFEWVVGQEVICTNDVFPATVINCSGLRNDWQSGGKWRFAGLKDRGVLMQFIDIYYLASDW